jgi:hypothetical protein
MDFPFNSGLLNASDNIGHCSTDKYQAWFDKDYDEAVFHAFVVNLQATYAGTTIAMNTPGQLQSPAQATPATSPITMPMLPPLHNVTYPAVAHKTQTTSYQPTMPVKRRPTKYLLLLKIKTPRTPQ